MAVPVIGVTSVTKSPVFSVYRHDGGNVTASTTYVDLTALTIPSVVDGQKVFVNFTSYHSTTNNRGGLRLIGATSGTVIHEYDNPVGVVATGIKQFGIFNLEKTTGVTEDIKVQVKSNNSTFHSEGFVHSGKSTDNLEVVSVGDKYVTVKQTLQIDEVDMVAIGSVQGSHNAVGCPTVGFHGSGGDTNVQTFYPNKMVNEMSFTNSMNEANMFKYQFILYSFTGKKLSMS